MDSDQLRHGPTPLEYQNHTQWDHTTEIPVVVSAPGEQDTAKYVYEATPKADVLPDASEESSHKPRTFCGLSLLVFCTMVALVAIATAGVLGGGVGGGMAVKHCRKELKSLRQSVSSVSGTITGSPSTSIASPSRSTASATAAPSTITVPDTGCPSINGSMYTAKFGRTTSYFTRICDTVKTNGDMFQISTPSWAACMDACAQYNTYHQTANSTTLCAGVSYVPEWSVHPEYAYSNYTNNGSCWFKDEMGGLPGNWPFTTEVVSAIRS
ncbi:hypothetical protein DE146DRAFT_339798 [Phaeosphaeria sp. MPI-PUGE-AT-0046c]|nr:hypothetical protein DE146DRAFT_339798 [Phaeosphaeria sp. MPI-PUGE-AT-0046c]